MKRTNQEQVAFHLERMQYWQGILDDADKRALMMAHAKIRAMKPREDGLVLDPHYVAKQILRDNWQYKRATSQRDGFQKGLETYSAMVRTERPR